MIRPYKILIKSKSQKYLVTIAIGSRVYQEWNIYALPLWKKYCKKNSIGLIVFDKNIIDKKNFYWKKPTWQKMLLADSLITFNEKVTDICYLDTDILINPNSPNIFDFHKRNKISVVSETYNLPFDLYRTKKKVSFFRNKYYSKKYPLDSSLFMSVKEKYRFHKFKPQKDYFCAGLIMFNLKAFSNTMKKWFFKYNKDQITLTGGGDEPIMNFEIFNTKKVNILNYKFQALWFYEMADKYSFLYNLKDKKNQLVKFCIEEALMNNYFLHFPGSWYEGKMWKIKNILINKIKTNSKLNSYIKRKSKGKPAGRIIPL